MDDRPATEMNVGFYLSSVFEKALGVLEFKIEVVIVGIGAEAYFLDYSLGSLRLDLLLFLLLLVKELVVVDDPHDGRVGLRRDLDQVESHLPGPIFYLTGVEYGTRIDFFSNGFADFVDVIAYEANFGNANLIVGTKLIFRVLTACVAPF